MAWLIIKNDGIGDLVLASGLITAVAKLVGPVDLLTCSGHSAVAEMIQGVRKIIKSSRDRAGFSLKDKIPSFYGEEEDDAAVRYLQEQKYEGAICLRRFIRKSSLRFMRVVNASEKYCCWEFPTNCNADDALWASKGWQFASPANSIQHELSYNSAFLENIFQQQLSATPCLQGYEPFPQHSEVKKVGLIISGSSCKLPEDFLIELVGGFAGSTEVILFGGPQEADLHTAAEIVKHFPKVQSLVGKLPLNSHCEEFAKCSLILGNDTGLTHLASVVHPKVVVLMGGGTFKRFFPWPGSQNQLIIHHSLECYDCMWQCNYRRCLNFLEASEVIECSKRFFSDKCHGLVDLNDEPVDFRPASTLLFEDGRPQFNRPVHDNPILNTPGQLEARVAMYFAFCSNDTFNASGSRYRYFDEIPDLQDDDFVQCAIASLRCKIPAPQSLLDVLEAKGDDRVIAVQLMLRSSFSVELLGWINRNLATMPDDLFRRLQEDVSLTDTEKLTLYQIFQRNLQNPVRMGRTELFPRTVEPLPQGEDTRLHSIFFFPESSKHDLRDRLKKITEENFPFQGLLCFYDRKILTWERQIWHDFIINSPRQHFWFEGRNFAFGVWKGPLKAPVNLIRKNEKLYVGSPDLLNKGIHNLMGKLSQVAALRVALYGGGLHSERLLQSDAFSHLQVVCVLDDFANDSYLMGIPVVSPARCAEYSPDVIVVSSDTIEGKLFDKAVGFSPNLPVLTMYTGEMFVKGARNE